MFRDFVKVLIRCRCGFEWDLCVPVALAVPGPLRCRPGPSIVPPNGTVQHEICCPRCRFPLFGSDPVLIERVEEVMRRGRGTHVADRAVIIDCR